MTTNLVAAKLWRHAMAVLFVLLFACRLLHAADAPREKLLLDANWKFSHGDPAAAGKMFDYPESDLSKQGAKSEAKENELAAKRPDEVKTNLGGGVTWVQAGFDDAQWRTVNLPHDWALELPFDKGANTGKGSKPLGDKDGTGIGWYRRTFELPAADKRKTVWIEFGGAYRNTLVWLNGHCLGRMESGYTPFYFDVSGLLNYGGKNTLVARVEAFKNEGWFYEGAGLYRHVWLIKTSALHVAHWGTYVTTKVSGAAATVASETTLENAAPQPSKAELVTTIEDSAGAVIAQDKSLLDIPAAGQVVVKQSLPVPSPQLWSPETPTLYVLVTRVQAAGGLTDLVRTPFGIRTVEFTPNGFLLNGKPRFIKGVCNHQDFAGVGAAVPDRVQEYRVAMLKEMGCDGWRTSHNPVNEELLDECDRQGMMVMDETRRFGQYRQPLADLQAMMRRDRNHPSIVIWSLGNEEMGVQGSAYGAEACKVMQDLAHRLDPSRLCTLAINHQFDNDGFTTVLDVTGINYLKLWGSMSRLHEKYPARRFITSEEASTLTTRGLYFEDKPKGYLTAYDTYVPGWGSTAEGWWNYYQTRPWVAGGFVWTGYDYRGEPTPYGWPCISSHFGIMDTCGFPKDNYYYYKAWWTREPVLHLYPHWNWNQVSHQMMHIKLTTALPQAELWCQTASLGKVSAGKKPAEWTLYDDGTIKQLQIILNQVTKEPDGADPKKTKDKVTPVVKQDFSVTAGSVTLNALKPGDAPAVQGSVVTISKEDAPIEVWVQSNLEEVELFVNGASAGRQKVNPLHHLQWTVPYTPGTISATGYKDGKAVQTQKIETTGAPATLRATANRTTLRGDGEDVVLVKVEALDAQGRIVPTAGNLLHFAVTGSGKLLGVGNGDPSCHESDLGPDRSLFNGLALGVVQAARTAGTVSVTVSAAGLKESVLTIPVQEAPVRPSVP